MPALHADELPVDAHLVRRLVDRELPDLAGRRLVAVGASGSSNALFRLGPDLVVRMPRQPGGGASIDKEARWLPWLRDRISVAVPEIVAVGEPGLGYPERWAVCRWIEGVTPGAPAAPVTTDGGGRLALDLARFVSELRAMPIPAGSAGDAELTWYRGLPLWALDEDFRRAVEQCRPLGVAVDLDGAHRVWDRALEASRAVPSTEVWFHGDLMAENLLLDPDGRLAAVLDFGGLAIGDPAVDLVVAWEVLDAAGRQVFRSALTVDDAVWTTSRGWAVFIALMTFAYYGATMPRRCADRLTMARAAIADD